MQDLNDGKKYKKDVEAGSLLFKQLTVCREKKELKQLLYHAVTDQIAK